MCIYCSQYPNDPWYVHNAAHDKQFNTAIGLVKKYFVIGVTRDKTPFQCTLEHLPDSLLNHMCTVPREERLIHERIAKYV